MRAGRTFLGGCSGLLAFIFACLVAELPTLAAESAKTVTIHQVPPAVKKTIESQSMGFKLGNIEMDCDDSEVTYTTTITKEGRDSDFTVAEDGRLLSVELTLEEAPAAVQKTIKAQLGQGELDSLENNLEENTYEIEYTRKDGTDGYFSVKEDGKLLTVQVALAEVPPVVRKTIEANLGKGKLGNVYRTTENGEVSFDAEVSFEEKQREMSIAENGKLESMQVFLAEAPEPVQKTIREKLGSGKLIRIDHSFVPDRGVLPYEIEARKDGKPFNFSVGPKGRFLGMDE